MSATAYVHRKVQAPNGGVLDMWEDPATVEFGWGQCNIEEYAAREQWVMCYNAIILNARANEARSAQ